MGLTTMSGSVSGVREHSNVSGNRDQVQTQRSVHLRIGNRAASMKSCPHLMDGDIVTVAGKDSAEFEILALRNESSGVIYQVMNPLMAIIGGIVLILCSVPMIILVFPPFLMIPMGIYIIWKGFQAQKAAKLLQSTPVQSPV